MVLWELHNHHPKTWWQETTTGSEGRNIGQGTEAMCSSRGQHSLTLQQQMPTGLTGPPLLDGIQGHVEDPLHLWLRMGCSLNVRLSSSTRAPGSKDLDVLTTVISHGLIQRRRQYTTHLSGSPTRLPLTLAPLEKPQGPEPPSQ